MERSRGELVMGQREMEIGKGVADAHRMVRLERGQCTRKTSSNNSGKPNLLAAPGNIDRIALRVRSE